MSTFTICDYCGEEIEDGFWAKISLTGNAPDRTGVLGYKRLDTFYGHYHSDAAHGCLERVEAAIFAAHDSVVRELESIPTISGQAVAARRRRHQRPESS